MFKNYADDFPHPENLYYLNHAAVGPWPLCTQQAVVNFAQENSAFGATHYPRWMDTENKLRELLRVLINAASTNEIALMKNTSEALSVIAHGLPWRVGDNVVLSSWEFPSNRIVWESLKPYGVEVRIIECDRENPENQLINACDSRTRLLSSSSVHYANGFTMNMRQLGEYCRRKGILFCVDAIQSLGVVSFDAQACYADFVVADGHKWMLAPEGLAVFYCRAEVMNDITLRQYGWHMVECIGDYDRKDWQVASNARRFECGSPNMLGIHAMAASLDYLLNGVGMKTVSDNVSRNVLYLVDIINKNKYFCLHSDCRPERLAGIVTFTVTGADHQKLYQKLMQNNVICAYRSGGIRLSPHFYQTTKKLQEACMLIERLIS